MQTCIWGGQLQGKDPRETISEVAGRELGKLKSMPRPKCHLCGCNKDGMTSVVPARLLLGINCFCPVSPATEPRRF